MTEIDDVRTELLEKLLRNLISPDEFRSALGLSSEEVAVLGGRLAHEAVKFRDRAKLDFGLIVCHLFGFAGVRVEFLHSLIAEDWHQMHERIVDAVLSFRDPASVDILWEMARKHLAYREWDDAESLEVKCTHGLWKLGTAAAGRRLGDLAVSAGPRTRKTAARLLRELAADSTPVGAAAASVLAVLRLPVAGSEEEDE